eukprot:7702466-Ditylum_brightwellii.AAC.1
MRWRWQIKIVKCNAKVNFTHHQWLVFVEALHLTLDDDPVDSSNSNETLLAKDEDASLIASQ